MYNLLLIKFKDYESDISGPSEPTHKQTLLTSNLSDSSCTSEDEEVQTNPRFAIIGCIDSGKVYYACIIQ